MSVDHLLNATGPATLYRNRPTYVAGRRPENFVAISSFPVRRPFAPGAAEMEMASRLDTKVTHITYTQPYIDIQVRDRITIEGLTYEVVGILPPSKPHHIKVMLERREYGSVA